MSVFTNKHVVVAMIVAPILAILAYFGVDAFVSEKPHAALSGSNYELLEKPNCRYSSGVCGLKNGDFELKLNIEWQTAESGMIHLRSIFPLDGARVAIVEEGQKETPPVAMQPVDQKRLVWQVPFQQLSPETSRIRVAVSSNEVIYFGDVAATFSVYETSFGGDFRSASQ